MDAVEPLKFSHDDGDEATDPHFWTDPSRVELAADAIADSVVEHVDGVDSAVVRSQAASYKAELDKLAASMEESFAGIEPGRRKLITNHHVFGYLAQRFGFEVIGAVIPSGTTLASPSSADLNDLTGKIQAAGVVAIFADSSQPERLAQVLAAEAGPGHRRGPALHGIPGTRRIRCTHLPGNDAVQHRAHHPSIVLSHHSPISHSPP